MNRILSAAILTLALGLQAQTAPDGVELTELLKDFLAGASRNDAAMHDRFWADDLIYTSSAGRRMGKADIMRDVSSSRPAKAGVAAKYRNLSQAQRQMAGGELAIDQNAEF